MNGEYNRERCNILRCLADMSWAEDEDGVEKNYEAAKEELRKYYDKLVEQLAKEEKRKREGGL